MPIKINHFIFIVITHLIVLSGSFYFLSSEAKHNQKQLIKNEISQFLNVVKFNSENIINQSAKPKSTRETELLSYLNRFTYQDFYVWANDQDGIAKVHVSDSVRGKFQKSYMRHIDNILENNIAFEEATNVNPMDNKRRDKINGYFLLKPWNWIIGYGKYIDQESLSNDSVSMFLILFITVIILESILLTLFIRIVKKRN